MASGNNGLVRRLSWRMKMRKCIFCFLPFVLDHSHKYKRSLPHNSTWMISISFKQLLFLILIFIITVVFFLNKAANKTKFSMVFLIIVTGSALLGVTQGKELGIVPEAFFSDVLCPVINRHMNSTYKLNQSPTSLHFCHYHHMNESYSCLEAAYPSD